MDNVLFYGQGDDASRRQVRSAAAQHSHRVGPRKPKKSLRGGNDAAPVRRRAASHQKSTSTASSSEDAAETTPAQNATSPGCSDSIPTAYRGSGATITPVAQQAVQRGFEQSQPTTSWTPSYGTKTPETAPSPQYHYQQVTPPASGSTPHRRLPQYSWTEYPRYGMSACQPQSLQMYAGPAEDRQYAGSTTVEGHARPRPQLPLPPPTSGPSPAMHPYYTSGST